MDALSARQVPVTFEDVAVYFSPEEWAELAEWQKELYQDVMEANFELVASLGSWPPKPELICKIEQGEDPCVAEASQAPSSEEWAELAEWQKELYQDVMEANFELVASLGSWPPKPELICKIEQGEDPCVAEASQAPSSEEWAELAEWQKELYQDVMEANFELVASLGSWPPKPELICKIEQGEDPCVAEASQAPSSAEWSESVREAAIKEESDGDWQQPPHPDGIASGPHPLETGRPSWCEVQRTDPRSVLEAASEGGGGPWEMGVLPPKELLICSECGRSFEEWESLSEHQALHREERGAFACTSCGKLFRYRLSLLAHKKHRGKRRYPCSQCGLQLCLRGDVLRHRAGHAAEGAHACDVCGLVFRHKGHLLAHEGEHGRARPHACPTCSQACGSEAELSAHQAGHREEERPFVCAKCGESFSWKESLQVHQRVHAQEGGHPCPVCGKTFSRHGNLLTHQRLHTGELPFACRDCDRSFPNKASLMAHSRLHRRCQPFACRRCGRSFRFQEKLLQHEASHGAEEVRVKGEAEP